MPNHIKLPKPWSEIVSAYGGRRAFAEKIGVNEGTVYRWALKKTKMSLATQNEVKRLAEIKGIKVDSI